MSNKEFCDSIDYELTSWHNKLQEATLKFDTKPSIDKYRVTTQIEGLHILLAELQDRISELRNVCFTGEFEPEKTDNVGEPTYSFKEEKGVNYDYDFGG